MIKEAEKCGADSVKLQINNPEIITSKSWVINAQKKANFTLDEYLEIKKYAIKSGIHIFSSAGDIKSLQIFKKLNFDKIKISSSNLRNMPLHEEVAELGIPVVLSTGDSYLNELTRIVKFYKSNKVKISLLHCISNYPANVSDTYLRSIPFLKDLFDIQINVMAKTSILLGRLIMCAFLGGYSIHSLTVCLSRIWLLQLKYGSYFIYK